MVRYGARLFSRNFLGLVTFNVQLITNILKQLIFDLSDFPHLLLNMSLCILSCTDIATDRPAAMLDNNIKRECLIYRASLYYFQGNIIVIYNHVTPCEHA